MVDTKNAVGRPPKTDQNGVVIETKVINVNVPVYLIEFLRDKKVNRSELFSKVCLDLFKGEICPSCYSIGSKSSTGIECFNCSHNYYRRTGESKAFFFKYFHCKLCEKQYSQTNRPALKEQTREEIALSEDPKIGCWSCLGKPDFGGGDGE